MPYIKHSPLQGLNMGGNATPGVSEYHYDEILTYLNAALIEIHTTVVNPIQAVKLTLDSAKSLYMIDWAFVDSNTTSSEPVKYLSEVSGLPFKDPVRQIVDVKSQDPNKPILHLNNPDQPDSLWIRNNTMLYVPKPGNWEQLYVTYKFGPKLIEANYGSTGSTALQQEVDIKPEQINAVISYLVYRCLNARSHLDPNNTRFAHRTSFYNAIKAEEATVANINAEAESVSIFEQNGYL